MPATLATGTDLIDWRGRLGWSVPRAAAELRILPPSLRNLESGRKTASAQLLRLAEVLEQLAAASTATSAPIEPRSVPVRKPRARKTALVPPADPFDAAVSRVGIRNLSTEAETLLKAAVERRAAGYRGGRDGMPAPGEDLVIWRQRQRGWHAAVGGEGGAPLDVVAAAVEAELGGK